MLIASDPIHATRHLIAGELLREPILQYGLFVMHTTDQIRQTLLVRQALLDFQAERLSF